MSQTLGISCGHDAGVTILRDDRIVFAASEERFTRVKYQRGFPLRALEAATHHVDLERTDRIAIEGRMQAPRRKQNLIVEDLSPLERMLESGPIQRLLLSSVGGVAAGRLGMAATTLTLRREYRRLARRSVGVDGVPVRHVEHHDAHALSALGFLPEGRGTAITVDAIGEGFSGAAYAVDGRALRRLRWVPGLHSPGLLYLYVTILLGFRQGQEGKVTGLAARGDPEPVRSVLSGLLRFDPSRGSFLNTGLGYGRPAVDLLRRRLTGRTREEIAAGVQAHLEELVLAFVRHWHPDEDTTLYLAGGVFANVLLNMRILESYGRTRVLVAPPMGDVGLSLGSALALHSEPARSEILYTGSTIVGDAARTTGGAEQLPVIGREDAFEEAGRLLAEGRIVAVARGGMEFGPRALGNRSILVSPHDASINDRLNDMLGRSEFMPFAPIVREEDASEYFDLSSRTTYDHMTITCRVRPDVAHRIPAVVHVDGTARPQVLRRGTNPVVHDILGAFRRRSGLGVLVNTSFNLHEEPIVADATDAVRTFLASGIDALLLGDTLLGRPTVMGGQG